MDTIGYDYLKDHNFEIEGLIDPINLEIDLLLNPDLLGSQPKLVFKNCVFCQIRLQNINAEKCHVLFEDCEVEGLIDVNNCIFEEFSIEESNLSNIRFLFSKIQSITFPNAFVESLEVILSEIRSLVIERDSHFKKCFIDSPKLDYLSMNTENQIEEAVLRKFEQADFRCDVNRVRIQNGEFKQLSFSSSYFNNHELANIKEFISYSLGEDCNLSFYNVFVNQFRLLSGKTTTGSVVFSETFIRDFEIYDSILPGLYCNRLTLINSPQIMRSDITDAKMNNIVWPNKYLLKMSDKLSKIPVVFFRKSDKVKYSRDELNELSYLKDSYRQLKLASQKNSNDLMAMQFYSNEMQTFWKEIRISGGVNWQDRILIFLQRWSSNFGQSWALPLLWLFLFHGLLFSCLVSWYCNNHLVGEYEFGQFWIMLNPVHAKPDFVNTGAGMFTDFIVRLFDAYFIYHFVKVSRKFVKGQ